MGPASPPTNPAVKIIDLRDERGRFIGHIPLDARQWQLLSAAAEATGQSVEAFVTSTLEAKLDELTAEA